MKIKFSYEYNEDNLPVLTCCNVEYNGKAYFGTAYCNTKYDFPNKRLGRKIAFTHAIKGLPREDRAKLWEYYKLNYKI